jgi:hypothetical protein
MNGGQKVKLAIVDAVSTLPGEDGFVAVGHRGQDLLVTNSPKAAWRSAWQEGQRQRWIS